MVHPVGTSSRSSKVAATVERGNDLAKKSDLLQRLGAERLASLSKNLTVLSACKQGIEQISQAQASAGHSITLLKQEVDLLKEKTSHVKDLNTSFAIFRKYVESAKQLQAGELPIQEELEEIKKTELAINAKEAAIENLEKQEAALKQENAGLEREIVTLEREENALKQEIANVQQYIAEIRQENIGIDLSSAPLTPENGAIIPALPYVFSRFCIERGISTTDQNFIRFVVHSLIIAKLKDLKINFSEKRIATSTLLAFSTIGLLSIKKDGTSASKSQASGLIIEDDFD